MHGGDIQVADDWAGVCFQPRTPLPSLPGVFAGVAVRALLQGHALGVSGLAGVPLLALGVDRVDPLQDQRPARLGLPLHQSARGGAPTL